MIKALKNYRFIDLGKYLKKNLRVNKKPIDPILNYNIDNKINSNNGIVIYGAGYAGKQIFQELKKQ